MPNEPNDDDDDSGRAGRPVGREDPNALGDVHTRSRPNGEAKIQSDTRL